MAYEIDGKTIEVNDKGYLANQDDWSEELGKKLAAEEGIELTDKHWDLIKYLRSEFFDNAGNCPNMRNISKDMKKIWGRKVESKELYELFPQDPSKQGGKIAGLPESKRKGGY